MRRPVGYAVGVLAVGTESRVVSETVDRDFVQNGQLPIEVIVTAPDQAMLERLVGAVRAAEDPPAVPDPRLAPAGVPSG